jgi:DNA repair exonuclease SbcCD nuclease subunit
MKLLLIGDPHFRVDYIAEAKLFISQVERLLDAISSQLDAIVVMGDVLHTHEKIHSVALNAALDFFKMCISKSLTYVLVGNHDATSNTIFLENSHWMNVLKGWKNLIVVDSVISIEPSTGPSIVLCPYVPDGRFVEALNTHEGWKNSSLVLGHQLLDGAKMGPIVATGVEEWKDQWPMCISGHIHDKQRVKKNLFYLGSSMQHAFGESSDKTLCLYDTASNTWQELELEMPKKEIVYVDVQEANIDQIKAKFKDNKQYKIVLKGEAADLRVAKSLVKELKRLEAVKSVSLKETLDSSLGETSLGETSSMLKDNHKEFEVLLREKVYSAQDPFVTSLMEHLLDNKEDLSNKDVFIV